MYRTPLLLSCILGSCLDLVRLLFLLHVVGSSRLAAVALLLAFAVRRIVPPFLLQLCGRSMFSLSWRCNVQRSPPLLRRYVTCRQEIGDAWYSAFVLT